LEFLNNLPDVHFPSFDNLFDRISFPLSSWTRPGFQARITKPIIPIELELQNTMLEGFGLALLSVLPEMFSVRIDPLSNFEESMIDILEEETPMEPSLFAILAKAESPLIDIPDDVADSFTLWNQISPIVGDFSYLSAVPLSAAVPGKHSIKEVISEGEEIECELPVLVFDDIASHCEIVRLDSIVGKSALISLINLRMKNCSGLGNIENHSYVSERNEKEEESECELPVLVFDDIASHCEIVRLDSIVGKSALVSLINLRMKNCSGLGNTENHSHVSERNEKEEDEELRFWMSPDIIQAFLEVIEPGVVLHDIAQLVAVTS
jgi:hypothetical protein